jgi:hypothetical protein
LITACGAEGEWAPALLGSAACSSRNAELAQKNALATEGILALRMIDDALTEAPLGGILPDRKKDAAIADRLC